MSVCSHLHDLMIPGKYFQTVDGIIEGIKSSGWNFDTIVGSGLSGGMLVPVVSAKIKKKMGIIRKPSEVRHSSNAVEVWKEESTKRYIIVDDLISSGNTLFNVIKVMSEHVPNARCVGVVLYLARSHADTFYNTDIPVICTYDENRGERPKKFKRPARVIKRQNEAIMGLLSRGSFGF